MTVEYMGVQMSPELAHDLQHHCTDTDSHEMLPVHSWKEAFPTVSPEHLEVWSALETWDQESDNALKVDVEDVTPINSDTVWNVRGVKAPGSYDFSRRAAVMDEMGIERQLVYATGGVCALMALVDPKDADLVGCSTLTNFPFPPGTDHVAVARDMVRGFNEWVVRQIKDDAVVADRCRFVVILETESIDQMMHDASYYLAQGVRAFVIPCGTPPANMSPADEALDPFYSLFEEANATLTIHVGTEYPFLRSRVWDANVPAFRSSRTNINEFPMQPYWGTTVNFAAENFLAAMVLGGVFERHPNLRFGSFENGAQWLGPFAERVDLWGQEFGKRLVGVLSEKPSFYLNRNVRVAPFTFEDVALYFERYPHVADCFTYFSDYPHREGGKASKEILLQKLANSGEAVIRKFFIENGRWVLPE